jgi:hypothetical protein
MHSRVCAIASASLRSLHAMPSPVCNRMSVLRWSPPRAIPTSYTDQTIVSGTTYHSVAEVNTEGEQSAHSNVAEAAITPIQRRPNTITVSLYIRLYVVES